MQGRPGPPVPVSIVTGANAGNGRLHQLLLQTVPPTAARRPLGAPPPTLHTLRSCAGLEVAAGLRQAGHHVVMACRSADKCAAAMAELDARGLPGTCECRQLDVADYASIRRFADGMRNARSIATLVNNAGVMGVSPGDDGTDGHMQPNHYGPFLLTRLLLPLMSPRRGRVVNVASEAHRRGSLRISGGDDGDAGGTPGGAAPLRLEGGPAAHWYASYGRSKLCNVLFTAELSRRLQQRGSGVTACSVSPGRVNTGIFSNVPGALRPALRWLAAACFQTPAQGARTVLHAVLSPELEGRHELYLHDEKACAASAAAQDSALAARLWRLSVQETGQSAAEDAALWPPQQT